MKELIHPLDGYKMNWVEGFNEWGKIKTPLYGLDVKKSRLTEGCLV